ncbi:hypothetical protein ASF91_17135 [Rhizobium sp. Leaf155]|nr:hypothetical protein ASF91_17135 [Rhizobium sp. Leaf155]
MTIGSHQRSIGKSQTHLTPPEIIRSLGAFDLDPCTPDFMPWCTAKTRFTEKENGLVQPWEGRVWLNPPFDRRVVGRFIERLVAHGNGIALVHARTEAAWFTRVWEADALLFLADRIHFCDQDGKRQKANSGAPLVLAAFGTDNVNALIKSGLGGFLVDKATRIGAAKGGEE